MKKLAIFMLILALMVLLVFGGYFYTSRLNVSFEREITPSDEGYTVCVTAHIKSISPLKTEWMTLTVDALPGDGETLYANAGPIDIEAFSETDLSVSFVSTSADERTGRLEYYILGRYHSIELASGLK